MDIKNLRLNYNKSKLDFNDHPEDPYVLFDNWFKQAVDIKINDVNAFVLSTVNINNEPSSRVVLLKEVNNKGFVFFTNYRSNKSIDIKSNPRVSINFHWKELEKQIRIVGIANKISRSESVSYFNSRPIDSQIGAIISSQSKKIGIDLDFNCEFKRMKSKFKNNKIRCPENWGGYCISPLKFEFWQGRPSRLHDRLLYELKSEKWITSRLSP